MKTESLARSLRKLAVLADLSDDHIEFLSGCTKNVRYEEGEYLFREGYVADHVFLLREGKVNLEIHAAPRGTIVVETLHAGELMGWSAIFPPYRWHVDGRAVKKTLAFAVDGACLRDKLNADHDFGYAFTRTMLREVHHRLERTRLHALDVYGSQGGSA